MVATFEFFAAVSLFCSGLVASYGLRLFYGELIALLGNLDSCLVQIKSLGAKAGVVLNPGTPLSAIEYVLEGIPPNACAFSITWPKSSLNCSRCLTNIHTVITLYASIPVQVWNLRYLLLNSDCESLVYQCHV